MTGRRWWRRLTAPAERTTGLPTSGNGASSFHLWWAPDPPPLRSAHAVLEVRAAPRVERLYFWALQVTFADGPSLRGGAHTGLQWNPRYPGSTAVNWGGYGAGGGLLDGTESPLPAATGDRNTRDYRWEPGIPYRLEVSPAGRAGWWRATVTDLASGRATVIRDLAGTGGSLVAPVVWSEVFARCDDPPVEVRWSDLGGTALDGSSWRPAAVRVSYQAVGAGGCSNTDVAGDGDGLLQRTSVERTVPDGSFLPLG